MSTSKLGRNPTDLSDAELERALIQLYATRADTFFDGSAQALRTHTDRMLELEHEYAARHPDRTAPAPRRTRRGSRSQDGRSPDGRR